MSSVKHEKYVILPCSDNVCLKLFMLPSNDITDRAKFVFISETLFYMPGAELL